LPTYRRIEQDLKNIFPDLEVDIDKYRNRRRYHSEFDNSNFIELVEFGMEDVVSKISRKLSSIKENLNNQLKNNLTGAYLRDVINRNYRKINFDYFQTFNEDAFLNILDRIDETVLAKKEKSKLLDFVREIKESKIIEKEENKIIAYFIYRLSIIYDELKVEEKEIINFIEKCNAYTTNKKLVYDNINFKIKICPIKDNEIQLNDEIQFKDLSSGEKQLISLFSQVYLSGNRPYFIIIDEPELSLSVLWQKRFLPDVINNNTCSGLLAVTHSPFIFENNLENYAHGLNEFEK